MGEAQDRSARPGVHSDSCLVSTTRLQFFDRNNVSLGSVNVPSSASGPSFCRRVFRRWRSDNNGSVDVVDDFIHGEPTDRIFASNFE